MRYVQNLWLYMSPCMLLVLIHIFYLLHTFQKKLGNYDVPKMHTLGYTGVYNFDSCSPSRSTSGSCMHALITRGGKQSEILSQSYKGKFYCRATALALTFPTSLPPPPPPPPKTSHETLLIFIGAGKATQDNY